jgi:hypothetical protein
MAAPVPEIMDGSLYVFGITISWSWHVYLRAYLCH